MTERIESNGERTSKRASTKALAVVREKQALDLRIRGKPFRAIAKEMGVSVSTAKGAYDRAIRRIIDSCTEPAEQVVRLELERLDAMHDALWKEAEAGNRKAVETCLKIQERRAKLLGIDAPVKQEITGKDGGPIVTSLDLDPEMQRKIGDLIARERGAQPPTTEETHGENQD